MTIQTDQMEHHGNIHHLDCLRKIGMEKKDLPQYATLKRASVLVPLFFRDSTLHMLLTKRPENLRSHAGEVCFPGGKQDPEDKNDDVVTAMREAHEEVGLNPENIEPVCRLDPIESVTGLCVTPIVGYIRDKNLVEINNLTLSKQEVEAAFLVPVSYFVNETNCASKHDIEWKGGTFVMRTFFFQAECQRTFKIWGLTAHVAYQVAGIISRAAQSSCALKTLGSPASYDHKCQTGYLMRFVENSGTGRAFWARRFFVCDSRMLHQYEGERQASRKAGSATKKNRLPLVQCEVTIPSEGGDESKYEFIVSTLQGRVQWRMAAQTDEERKRWKEVIESNTR